MNHYDTDLDKNNIDEQTLGELFSFFILEFENHG